MFYLARWEVQQPVWGRFRLTCGEGCVVEFQWGLRRAWIVGALSLRGADRSPREGWGQRGCRGWGRCGGRSARVGLEGVGWHRSGRDGWGVVEMSKETTRAVPVVLEKWRLLLPCRRRSHGQRLLARTNRPDPLSLNDLCFPDTWVKKIRVKSIAGP